MQKINRCLVLGGAGFIGSHLVDRLLELGYRVRCFDRPHVAPLGSNHSQHPNFELCEGEFSSETEVMDAMQDCDICFHLISTTLPKSSNADPVFDVESNLLGTVKLLTHAVTAGLKKVIFVSSGGTVYGIPKVETISETHATDPICSYGITKLAIEKYLGLFHELHGLDYAVLRLSNPFGERQRTQASQGAVAVFLGKALRGEVIEIWGDGSVVRDYIHIADVVSALIAAMQDTGPEHVFNIGSGHGLSLNELINCVERVTGKSVTRKYTRARAFDVPRSVLAIDRAEKYLKWVPKVGFEQGLNRFNDWLTEYPE